MPHFVLQTAKVPTPTSKAILSLKPTFPIPQLCHLRRRVCSNRNLDLKCSSSSSCPMIDGGGDSVAALERCFSAPPAPFVADFGPVMKGKFGSLGAVTLEKGKLDMSQKQSQSTPEVALGGCGGDIGKHINHGGGDGGDDDGDDDDYFDDFDEGDEGGLFRRRIFLEELFDRKFVDAVLNEWHGIFSSLLFYPRASIPVRVLHTSSRPLTLLLHTLSVVSKGRVKRVQARRNYFL